MPTPRRELLAFGLTLAALVGGVLAESLVGGKVLSPADVLRVQASFREPGGPDFEPANRLLIDPVLQFQPWLEFNRATLRRGRLPLWNPYAGCGAPHLANGQSAVFDPFHLIAYVGRLPDAHAWMAAARLWVAGVGMFLLARAWRLGRWGRWFAGLAYPFCGFLIVWLLFPVTSVAVWLPWLLWAGGRVIEGPTPRRVGVLALIAAATILGGHVQTSAHVLLAAAWHAAWFASGRRAFLAWALGIGLGVGVAAIEIVPLAAYLTRSPVWADRSAERPSPLAITRPRLLDAACTALPYAFGSQRRGQPNLAKALGVHNLNESAGGFAGLATLIWLAPLALGRWRHDRRVRFLGLLAAVGFLGAFELPPVANLLRLVPVLDVIDQRRLTLWLAFALVLLGGIGLDALAALPRRWVAAWVVGAAGLAAFALAFGPLAGPRLQARALAHYDAAAGRTPGADRAEFRARAERQVRQALRFVPGYYGLAAAQLLALALLAESLRGGRLDPGSARGAVLGLTLLDLVGFGLGLNPAISREAHDPRSPVVDYLRRVAPPPARVLAVGGELPPNTLMRYGLADVRNYDSVEMSANLDWFAPLYEADPGRPARTSRREVTWAGVARGLDRLRLANVTAVVGPTPPPSGLFERVDRVGAAWVGRLDPRPGAGPPSVDLGEIWIDAPANLDNRMIVPVTFDPGWRAEAGGRAIAVEPHLGAFLSVPPTIGGGPLVLRYDPPEVRLATAASVLALAVCAAALAGIGPRRSGRKNDPGAWMARAGRVRIGLMIPSRSSHRLPHEG